MKLLDVECSRPERTYKDLELEEGLACLVGSCERPEWVDFSESGGK